MKSLKEMLREEKFYDEKSIVFESGKLDEVKDAKDKSSLPEGRLGEIPIERIKTEIGVELFVPMSRFNKELAQAKAEMNTETCFRLETENRVLVLEKKTAEAFEMDAASYDQSENMLRWNQNLPGNDVTEWAGIVQTLHKGPMLGTVSGISKADGDVYVLTYAGIGNFTDIRMEKTGLLKLLYKKVTR